MGNTGNCYNCDKRYVGCHSKCEDYTPNNYDTKFYDHDYMNYLNDARGRMKRSRNLFRRGVRHEQ